MAVGVVVADNIIFNDDCGAPTTGMGRSVALNVFVGTN
jgi:hypothetical protein